MKANLIYIFTDNEHNSSQFTHARIIARTVNDVFAVCWKQVNIARVRWIFLVYFLIGAHMQANYNVK